MNQSFANFVKQLDADIQVSSAIQQATISKFFCKRSGALVIALTCPEPLAYGQIIGLEQLIERKLKVAEAIIVQEVLHPEQYFNSAEEWLISGIAHWLSRHAERSSQSLARYFLQATYVLTSSGKLRITVPILQGALLRQGENWCRAFGNEYFLCAQLLIVSEQERTVSEIPKSDVSAADTIVSSADAYEQATSCCHHHATDQTKKGESVTSSAFPYPIDRRPPVPQPVSANKPANKEKNFKRRQKHRVSENVIWGKPGEPLPLLPIVEIDREVDRALFRGEVFEYEARETKTGNILIKFSVTDMTSSMHCIMFVTPEVQAEIEPQIKSQYLQVTANISFDDTFSHDYQARVTCIESARRPQSREDKAQEKRIELHIHSKMSAKDAISDPARIIQRAHEFGHKAIALTDHGVVQGFPEAANAVRKVQKAGGDLKLIYGVEGYLLPDGMECIAYQCEETTLAKGFHLLALEKVGTPRLGSVRNIHCLTITVAEQNEVTGEQRSEQCLSDNDFSWHIKTVNYQKWQLHKDDEITSIIDCLNKGEKWANSDEQVEMLMQIKEYLGDLPVFMCGGLDALNSLRYEGFRVRGTEPRVKFNPPLIDLDLLFKSVQADLPTELTGEDNLRLLAEQVVALCNQQELARAELTKLNSLVDWQSFAELKQQKKSTNHIILLVEDQLGLYNLYRMVSDSHLKYFYYKPRIPRSVMKYFGAGIKIGGACVYGEIYQRVHQIYKEAGSDYNRALELLKQPENIELAQFYSYLEVQPLGNNLFLTRKEGTGVVDKTDLQNINKLIIELGKLSERLVCATSDSHFLEPQDDVYRRILLSDMNFEDADDSPDLYLRTTDEMFTEFAYLPEHEQRAVILSNPQAIADDIEADLLPFPDGSFPPIIQSAADEVQNLTLATAHAIYGIDGKLPEIVEQRVQRELTSIIDNGFAIMYYIAHKLVKKSNDDGYVVGSRGSVGSSLVATLCGITEVNPLLPHYICPKCHYFEPDETGNYGSGFDLPERCCPKCGEKLKRDGQDIPFETFLGFDGDKQPDIDLNFSGFYQARAHRFIEEMFGSEHTFRAGTISGFAEKNSLAMVAKYVEDKCTGWGPTEIRRIAQGLIGIKRTTGQHPGGIVVVPKEREIYDFTPIQHPADKGNSDTITTHFDFNAMHDTILKLDVLGHDDPSMLKMLTDQTGVKIEDIPVPDEKVMSLFQSTEALGIDPEKSTIKSATIGLPELGTLMARDMIAETKPSHFYDLVQLSGLSHGTDVWKGNAQELIRQKICTINDVIGCRDSIMTTLIYRGLPAKAAFTIMEKVRKGKGLSAEDEVLMRQNNVPDWYIDSCKKIKYMFPKAHAAAYIISALRIAWFKVYYPESYYCAQFTIRAMDDFKSEDFCLSADQIRIKRAQQRNMYSSMTKPEQKKFYILEWVEEMQQRGIDFLPIDLMLSHATNFTSPAKGQIRPPLNVISGISTSLAQQIVDARADGPFPNCENLQQRAHLGPSVMDALKRAGLLEGLPESAQIDLFSLV